MIKRLYCFLFGHKISFQTKIRSKLFIIAGINNKIICERCGKTLKITPRTYRGEREDICLRCGVEHKEVKREGSNGCHSRGFHYPKHLWK